MVLNFNIIDWKAWFPTADDEQPDVSMIPAMLRRRLSPVARIAMSVIMPLVETHGAMPLVYVSRHGDLNRTFQLLKDLCCGEPLSPTAFSLSVHNATAGLFSIQQGLTKNITAISCGDQELIPALLEAVGQCNADEPNVLCIFCDEPPPAIYNEQVTQPEIPYAVALIISRGEEWQLTNRGPSSNLTSKSTESTSQPLELLKLLQDHVPNVSVTHNNTCWQLGRGAR
jgi:hypothetical protein